MLTLAGRVVLLHVQFHGQTFVTLIDLFQHVAYYLHIVVRIVAHVRVHHRQVVAEPMGPGPLHMQGRADQRIQTFRFHKHPWETELSLVHAVYCHADLRCAHRQFHHALATVKQAPAHHAYRDRIAVHLSIQPLIDNVGGVLFQNILRPLGI